MAVAQSIHTRIENDRKKAVPEGFRWSDIQSFRKYYRGRQKGTLNADQIRLLQGVIGNRFSHNICRKIVNEKAHRLDVARFDVEDESVRDFLFDLWVKNQFPDLFADLMVATLRDSNACIGINWIPTTDTADAWGGRVALFLERWWDGKSGAFVQYDGLGQPEYAVKEWTDALGVKYRTIYFPDHLERYRGDGDGWTPYRLDSDPDDAFGLSGIVVWAKRNGEPLGIPIVHFANGNDDDSNYGGSELDGGVLGFQDQINAIQHDITAVSMLSGSPRTTSKGFVLEEDEAGNKKQPKVGPGAHWHVDDETAEWGVLEAGDIGPLKDGLWLKVQSVCQMTDTPIHAITGDWPSGEALFRAEMPLVQAVEKLAKKVGPSTSTIAHRSTEIANTFGRGPLLDENALITTIFFPVDKRDPLTQAMFAEKISAFVSKRETLRVLGYSPTRIDEILAELDKEADVAAERQQALFSAGVTVPPASDNPGDRQDDPEEGD